MFKENFYHLEKKILEWLNKKRIAVFVYLVVIIIIFSSYFMPYVNLYVNNHFTFFLILLSMLLIFQIPIQKIAVYSVWIVILSAFLVLIKDYDRAEILMNIVYGLLFTIIISSIWKQKGN